MNVGQGRVEHHARIVDDVMNKLCEEFFSLDKKSEKVFYVDKLVKLSSMIGFMAQTATGQSKAILYETEIKKIKRTINRVPPEVLEQYITPTTLEIFVDGRGQAAK